MRKKLKQFEQATVAGEKQNVCDSKTMRHAAQECRDWQAKFGGDDKLTFKTALDLLQAKGVLKPEDIKRKRIQHLLQQKELRSTTEDNDLSSESEYSSAASEPSPLCPYKRTQQGQLAQAKSQQQFTDNIQSGSLGDAVGDADSTVHQLEQGSVQAGFKPVNKDHPLQRVIMQHIDDMALFLLSEEGKAKKDSIYSVVCNPRHAVKPFLRDSDLDNLVFFNPDSVLELTEVQKGLALLRTVPFAFTEGRFKQMVQQGIYLISITKLQMRCQSRNDLR
ncbi:TPA: hypothetical protein ACH3X1_011780 [Trebouxia sp. C0004]